MHWYFLGFLYAMAFVLWISAIGKSRRRKDLIRWATQFPTRFSGRIEHNTEERLESCPCCGSHAQVIIHPEGIQVACSDKEQCKLQTAKFGTRTSAIEAWNRRVQNQA